MEAKEKLYFLTRVIPPIIRCEKGGSFNYIMDFYFRTIVKEAKDKKYKENKKHRAEQLGEGIYTPYRPQVSKENCDSALEEKCRSMVDSFMKSIRSDDCFIEECDRFADLLEDMVESIVPGGNKEIPDDVENRIRDFIKYKYDIEWSSFKKGYRENSEVTTGKVRAFMAGLIEELIDFADTARGEDVYKYFNRCQRCNRIIGMTKKSKKYCDNSCQTSAASRRQNDRLRGL